jgi:Protein of unknown function (DUF1524)
MPRTATAVWHDEVTPDLTQDETFEVVHQALEHTIGNLTLTGYNSSLSNSSFATKKDLLATSGLRMNQEIAAVDRWGKPPSWIERSGLQKGSGRSGQPQSTWLGSRS